jgi:hypothetical protein
MSSFKAALAAYKKTTTEVVPVNPPEAVAAMEEKTVPEVETPKVEEPKKRAPRGSSKKSVEPTESSDSVATDLPVLAADINVFVNALVDLGYAVTLTKAPRS